MTSGEVKQMVGKTVSLFSIKTRFSFSHFSCQLRFYSIHVFTIICHVFVLSFVAYHRSFRSENPCPRSFTLNEEIKRNQWMQDPCCMGAWGAARAENIGYSILNLCDSHCKPLSYKKGASENRLISKKCFFLHAKQNKGPVFQDVY